MEATQSAEERIMLPILSRLDKASKDVRELVVKAHATGKTVPGLDRAVARLTAAMRAASATAVRNTPGLERADTKTALDWRVAKVKALSTIVKQADKPALGVLVALSDQAAKFGADLTAKVSDTLVARHTTDQDRACGPGEVLIWQPERDACVRCLKYAGLYRDRGGKFQDGLSFDPDAPEPKGKLTGPPLHPNCRCELAVIPKHAATDNSRALAREAQRSVLKGWALPSEGDAVRTRAAQALVNSNVIAPKSVISETRKRLRSGAPFAQGVPAGPRTVVASRPVQVSAAERVAKLASQRPSSTRKLSGGESAHTELVTYPDGTKLVRKDHGRLGFTSSAEARRMTDAEVLGARVLDAVGLPAATVHKAGPTEVYSEFVEGRVGAELVKDPFSPVPRKILDSDDGRRMGLADLLMGEGDRNLGNWIQTPEGRLVGIDHGAAFGTQASSSPFARELLADPDARNPTVAKRNDWTASDLERLRPRLEALGPAFEASGRKSWFNRMMARLRQVENGAHGTTDRIT